MPANMCMNGFAPVRCGAPSRGNGHDKQGLSDS